MSGAGSHSMHFEKVVDFPRRNPVVSLASLLCLSVLEHGQMGDAQPFSVQGHTVPAASSAA